MTDSGDFSYTLLKSDLDTTLVKHISVKEQLGLQMALGSAEIERSQWESFWGDVESYDDLPYGCHLIMHRIIRKIQRTDWMLSWKVVGSKKLDFLSGLPKYNWTKNQVLRKHVHRIDAVFTKLPVTVFAFNGLAENIGEPGPPWIRSNPLAEVLIERQDYEESKTALEESGYELALTVPWNNVGRIAGTKRIFVHTSDNLSCHLYVLYTETDVNLRALYASLCKNAQESTQHGLRSLRIPDIRTRFLFSVQQVLRASNLATGIYLVHLMDTLNLLRSMTREDVQSISSLLVSGTLPPAWVVQVIDLGKSLGIIDSIYLDEYASQLKNNWKSGDDPLKVPIHTQRFGITHPIWNYYFMLMSEREYSGLVNDVLLKIKNRYNKMRRKQSISHPEKRYL
jgi:hypothetical protein